MLFDWNFRSSDSPYLDGGANPKHDKLLCEKQTFAGLSFLHAEKPCKGEEIAARA
jgi:hypothetical protein